MNQGSILSIFIVSYSAIIKSIIWHIFN